MKDYDYIIAGGGCAGLSLAARINRTELKDRRILILDTQPKRQNDKTWCFWSTGNQHIIPPKRSWTDLQVHTNAGSHRQDIAPLNYQFVSSIDFYECMYEELDANPNIEFKYERVKKFEDTSDGACVHTENGSYRGNWVFNSIITPIKEKNPRNLYLAQHFYGWFLKMEEDTFSKNEMTLMDFRVPQEDGVCFVYILPFNKKEALIEFTVFSDTVWDKERYEEALGSYMEEKFPFKKFAVQQEEQGVIPMTNHSFSRNHGHHILNIGTAGGFTKPTTGYTFRRIQEDTTSIVKALVETGNPYYQQKKKKRFAFYDNLLLYLIQTRGSMVHKIFNRLFAKNDFRKILKFLDEETSIREEMWIMGRLPWMPFLGAIWEYYILKKKTVHKAPAPALKKSLTHESTVAQTL